jgi:hypothetical protein
VRGARLKQKAVVLTKVGNRCGRRLQLSNEEDLTGIDDDGVGSVAEFRLYLGKLRLFYAPLKTHQLCQQTASTQATVQKCDKMAASAEPMPLATSHLP